MECRKRRASEAVDSLNFRAKRAAAAVLSGRSLSDMTRELGVPKQQVYYYVKKWKSSDMGDVLSLSSPSVGSTCTGSSCSQRSDGEGGGRCDQSPLLINCDLPPQYDGWRVFERKNLC